MTRLRKRRHPDYAPDDEYGAARHDAWQDFMIWYLLRRKWGVADASAPAFDSSVREAGGLIGEDGIQTPPNNTDTQILLKPLFTGTVDIVDEATDSLVVAAGYAGIWLLHGAGSFTDSGVGYRTYWIEVNGVRVVQHSTPTPHLQDMEGSFSTIVHLAEGDVVELWCRSSWLGALGLRDTLFYVNVLSGVRIGAYDESEIPA